MSRNEGAHPSLQKIIIVTGSSGAGKSVALKALEDAGYYCIDNLPVILLESSVERLLPSGKAGREYAFGMDIRDESFVDEIKDVLATLTQKGKRPQIIFLDCDEEVLARRFNQLRRRPPLAAESTIPAAIKKEKEILASLREQADTVIDTTSLSPHELRRQIIKQFDVKSEAASMRVNILSFGFKHGLPPDVDLLFDVRFLPNPYFVPELKEFTGLDKRVSSFVIEHEVTMQFFNHLEEMLTFLMPHYEQEGKFDLTIGIGCTGGKHRSVAVAEELKRRLQKAMAIHSIFHRDMEK